MTYCFGDIRAWSRKTLLGFCWVSIFLDSLIANITWTVAQAPINHVIFWKSVMWTFRCIYVNCFNTLRFLAEVSTKLKKRTSLDNLRTITQEGNMETRQMTTFFHLLSPLWLFVTFIFVFENCYISFSCGPPSGPSWSVKYPNFGQKLLIQTAYYTFLKNRHPEVTKNSQYVLSHKESQKMGISSWTMENVLD